MKRSSVRFSCAFLVCVGAFSGVFFPDALMCQQGGPAPLQSGPGSIVSREKLPAVPAVLPAPLLNGSRSSTPLEFIENRGQLTDQFQHAIPEVRYYAESHGVRTYYTKNSQHFVFQKSEKKPGVHGLDSVLGEDKSVTLYRADMTFEGASENVTLTADDRREDYLNFYLASCPDGLTQVPTYGSIRYQNLYPNIDLVVRGDGSSSKYEFTVHPGGRVSDIRMRYDDRERLTIASDGSLTIANSFGEMTEARPVSAQGDNEIGTRFITMGNTVTYRVAAYDSTRDLVIDPPRLWGTYYGGPSADQFYAVTTDASGNVYGTGSTSSTGGIATSGAFQTTQGGSSDAFLVKFSSTGARVWGTYIGGTDNDEGRGITVDGNGDILITGWTKSTTVIATTGAYQTTQTYPGYEDVMLEKFTSAGARTWGTYYGSTNRDIAWGIGTDASKNIYVGGTWAGYPNFGSPFVAKFNTGGTSLLWATTFSTSGGSGTDAVWALAVDAAGNSFGAGVTTATSGLATTGAHQTSLGGVSDAFVTRLNASGVVQWCTYYGGTLNDMGYGIAIDPNDYVYVTGSATSTTGIATTDAHQTSRGGTNPNAILSRWSPTGVLLWGTYFGEEGSDLGWSVAVDKNRNIVFGGQTGSSGQIATSNEYQTTLLGTNQYNAFLAEFDTTGIQLWGTYYGSGNYEEGKSVAIDSSNSIYLAGLTNDHTGAMATSGAYQTSNGGSTDGFLVKFCGMQTPQVHSTSEDIVCFGYSSTLSVPSGYSSYQWKLGSSNIVGATSNSYVVPNTLAIGQYHYSVVVTNGTGCIAISPSQEIEVVPNPTASAGTNQSICRGDSVTIGGLATGGQTPYSYAWSPSAGLSSASSSSPKASPATTTTYTVIATDDNGCQGTASVTVTVNPVPTLSVTRHVNTCAGTPIAIGSAAANGTAPYTYTWTPSTGLSSASIAQPIANPPSTTQYYVSVTDANGCHTNDSVQVMIYTLPVLHPTAGVSICKGSSTVIGTSFTVVGTTHTFAWSPAASLSDATAQYPTATPAATTRYYITFTDQQGCQARDSVLVIVNPMPTLSAGPDTATCLGTPIQIGNAAAAGTPPFTYSWTPSAGLSSSSVAQPLAAPDAQTTYTETVTDAAGCSASSTVTVKVRPLPLADLNGPVSVCPNSLSLYGISDANTNAIIWTLSGGGTIQNGQGSNILSVKWTNTGTWTLNVHVTTSQGCSKDSTISVLVDASLHPSVTASGSLTLCQNDSLVLHAPLGYQTYKWSSGEMIDSIIVRASGTYTVDVTNASLCKGTSQPVTVQVLSTLKPTPSITASATTICEGDSVSLTATPGYASYLWSDGSTGPNILTRKSGNYSVTATNASGCQGISSVVAITVLPSPPVSVAASGPDTICEGNSVTLTASAGFAKYQWSNGATIRSIPASVTGIYTVLVTNANGCTRTSAPISVTVVPNPAPIISGAVAACTGSTQTYTVANIAGSTTQWHVTGGVILTGQGTNTITVQWGAAGTGTLGADQSITAVGCQGSAPSLSVLVGSSLKPVIGVTPVGRTVLCGATDSLLLDAGGGYAHYSWLSGEKTQTILVRNLGTYGVTVDDGGTCLGSSDPITITTAQPPQPAVVGNGPLTFCEGDSVTLDAGAGFISYAWGVGGALIPGESKETLTVHQSGNYAVDVTNAAGCKGTSPIAVVTVNPLPPQPTITQTGGTLTSSAAQSYQWSLNGSPIVGATSQTLAVSSSGNYSVTITDANGCPRESLAFSMTTQGATTASVPVLTKVQPSEVFQVPIVLSGSRNLIETGATTFAGTLRVPADLVTPTAAGATQVGSDWLIPVSGPRSALSDTLTFVGFTAGTRDPNCGRLTFDTLYFPNALVQVTSASGEICVSGACSPWLWRSDTAFLIHSIIPNPSNGSFTIEYHTPTDGMVTLQLEDMLGRTATILKRETMKSGTYRETYDAGSMLASGVYRLELRSGARVLSKMLQVAH